MAETKNVPQLVEKLTSLRLWANPLLHRVTENSGDDSKERLHASLALLPVDEGQVEYLYSRLLDAGPAELEVIQDALRPFQERLIERLWRDLGQSDGTNHALQAASALVLYDPSARRWENVGGKVAEAMVTVNAVHLGFWLNALRPVRDWLSVPLAALYRDRKRSERERNLAFNLLEDYATDQPQVLTDLLMDSGEDHFVCWFGKLAGHSEIAVPLLEQELHKSLPDATEIEKDGLAERQARAAIAFVRMGHANEVWPKLQHSPDPRLRSFIVNWLAPLGVDPQQIAAELDRIVPVPNPTPAEGQHVMEAILFNPENSKRRALILALGQYGTDPLSPGEREPLITKLLDLYRTDPDAGVHGAAEWTLRRFMQGDAMKAADAELQKLRDRGDRRWYVNSQGQTFTVIEGPLEFRMGSPDSERGRGSNETLHGRRIDRRFALATKAVTREQYEQFARANPQHGVADVEMWSPGPQGPFVNTSWYNGAAYCNWLSGQEGLDRCYEPNLDGEYASGMKILPDFLERPGYRLPMEAEWEYACRAGTATSRYYGDSIELLKAYAWYNENSKNHAWPCGSLLPNDLGFFDMLGNVYEWCQEQIKPYTPDMDGLILDKITNLECVVVSDKDSRVRRGGTFSRAHELIRSAFRSKSPPPTLPSSSASAPAGHTTEPLYDFRHPICQMAYDNLNVFRKPTRRSRVEPQDPNATAIFAIDHAVKPSIREVWGHDGRSHVDHHLQSTVRTNKPYHRT